MYLYYDIHSLELKSLKRRLDAKLKARQAKCGRFKAKERVQGSASTLPSPQYPVEWAVSIVSGSNKDAVTSDWLAQLWLLYNAILCYFFVQFLIKFVCFT